jgi:UDP-N-acetylglucosamine--N-acetylmuramyl-(pentapeptide) pyrophosphoryl-undecaprenol N-acetylglucosamine transferase
MKFVLAAGGSAGHVYPAINTARAILELDPSAEVTIMGTDRGLDTTLVPPTGLALELLPSAPFPRKLDGQAIAFTPKFIKSIHLARKFMKKNKTDVVIGFGGYASAPAYLAAKSLGLCVIVHEANSTAGLANKLGSRITPHVASMFDGVIPGARVIGMPLSEEIVGLDRQHNRIKAREFFGLPQTGPVLLIFGGSQGAQSINSACVASISDLLAAGVSVIHSVGGANFQSGCEMTDNSGACYLPVPFIDRMDLAYSAADLVIARAGAMSAAEISTVGIPAIFIPLPIGNGEQKRNAQKLIDSGAARVYDNSAFTRELIVGEILPLILNASELDQMQSAMKAGKPSNAAKELARWGLSCS